MTERLYYDDATLITFEARVVEGRNTEGGPAVRLDRTAFYPTSGGQPYDTGSLGGIPVRDVWDDESGTVWHLLDAMPATDNVSGAIDWSRRFDHMQQHTGQHLLSAAFVEVFGANTIGFHLGAESSTIDLDIPNLSWEAAFRVEDEVNRVVWENRAVTIHSVTRDELGDIPLRKPPQVTGTIRIIWVEGYDASACGGTHVRNTGEIGLIKITGIERYKGGVRVAFLCGERALRDYRRVLHIVRETSSDLSVGQDALRETVARIQEEAKTVRRALNKALCELMKFEAERLWAATPEVDGVRRIVDHWTDRTFADARAIASQLREQPHTLLLLAVTEENGTCLVCARSDDLSHINAGTILREVATALGGRGGGSPAIAQGGARDHPHETIIAALQSAINDATA
jgi:alanyl-tRNA synthetase